MECRRDIILTMWQWRWITVKCLWLECSNRILNSYKHIYHNYEWQHLPVKVHDYPTLQHTKASDFEVCLLLFTEDGYVASYVTLATAYYIISREQTGYLDWFYCHVVTAILCSVWPNLFTHSVHIFFSSVSAKILSCPQLEVCYRHSARTYKLFKKNVLCVIECLNKMWGSTFFTFRLILVSFL